MRKTKQYLIVLCIGFCAALSGLSAAEEQKTPSGSIEVIVNGKQYESIHAYRREQIKKTLKRALSSQNLMEFSEDELHEIMSDIRKQQKASGYLVKDVKSSNQSHRGLTKRSDTVGEDSQDLKTSQMQEMLKEYRREHKSAGYIVVNPDKLKSVIIEPQK